MAWSGALRRRGAVALAVAAATAAVAALGVESRAEAATPAAGPGSCTQRVLVLSAFPAELDALLVHASVNAADTVVVDGRSFYVGTLGGNKVIMALTGIGPVNAKHTSQLAVDHFRCGSASEISAVVFSGVAGGRTNIGDVTVPARWTQDDGKTWLHVDPEMMAVARQVAGSGTVKLEQDAPVGDPSCDCQAAATIAPVHMPNAPKFVLGGDGVTTDPVAGRAVPCVPSGGDIFGCEPCRAPSHATPDAPRLVQSVVPFVDPNFFISEFEAPPATTTNVDASDEETATVASVVEKAGLPFLGVRAISDGHGDPLMLPGFPFQFFYYRQISADNAGAMTYRFLQVWATHRAALTAAGGATTSSSTATAPATRATAGVAAAVTTLPDTAAGSAGAVPPVAVPAVLILCAGWARRRTWSARASR
ncbi:MAG: 5'-methylthioadenosine/S-adenosylhomocysteine nucleosidase [Chloroflexi bacterium]|nr:MAG: 5'-methylthioadenosine/S-adenosylhomocysteine nucleosidase [Chloroflexota bacterium]